MFLKKGIYLLIFFFSFLYSIEHKISIDSSGNGILMFSQLDESSKHKIVYKTTSDYGVTWSESIRLTTEIHNELSPNVVLNDNGNGFAIWIHYDETYYSLKNSYTSDYGITWSTPTNVTDIDHNAIQPDLAFDEEGNGVIVFSDDSSGDYRAYTSYSSNYGQTWSTPIRLSDNNEVESTPRVIISETGKVVTIWTATVSIDTYRIKSSYSSDYGVTWLETSNDVSNDSSSVDKSMIINTTGNVMAIWYEIDTLSNNSVKNSCYIFGESWTSPKLLANPLDSIPTAPNENISTREINLWEEHFDSYMNTGFQILASDNHGASWFNPILDDFENAPPNTIICGYLLLTLYDQPLENCSKIEGSYTQDLGLTWIDTNNQIKKTFLPGSLDITLDPSLGTITDITQYVDIDSSYSIIPMTTKGLNSKKIKYIKIENQHKDDINIIPIGETEMFEYCKYQYNFYSDDDFTNLLATCNVIGGTVEFNNHPLIKSKLLLYYMNN